VIDNEFPIIENEEGNNVNNIQLKDDIADGDVPEGTFFRNYLMSRMFL